MIGSFVSLGLLMAYVTYDGNPETAIATLETLEPGSLPVSGVSASAIYFFLNLAFPVFLLSIYLSLRLLHHRPFRTLITPGDRISWRRIGQGFSVFFILKVVEVLVSYLIAPQDFTFSFEPRSFALFVPIVFLVTPLQTTAEELFFRGYLLQGIGSKLGKWMAIVLPSLLFMLLHTSNPEVLTQQSWQGTTSVVLYYFIIGAFLAWLTLKDKTLELAIGVHAANNIATFLMVTSDNSVLPSPAIFKIETMEASFALIFFTLVFLLIFSFIVFKLLKRPFVIES